MRHRYLVGFSEREFAKGEFRIITATNLSEAINAFIRNVGVKDENFLGYVYDKAVNLSFAEHFWVQDEDEVSSFTKSRAVEINEEDFKRRVREFFGGHDDFADLYLNSYFEDDDSSTINHDFPDEMLVYIWDNHDWSSLTAFDLAHVEEIQS